jgi:PAS domain S-box-containing protein
VNALHLGPNDSEELPDRRQQAAILRSLPMGLYVLDREWRFVYLNPIAERFFERLSGRTRAQLLGKSIREECPEFADSTFSKEYGEALAEGRTFEMETYYPDLDRWFAVRAAPGEEFRCVYFQDVTERTRLERALRRRAEELSAADQGKDAFLASLAHEVRNALAPVRNALHLLAADESGRGRAEPTRAAAEKEVEHLSGLMDDLLKVARPAPEAPRNERVEVAGLVARAVQAALVALEARGRNFTVSLPLEPLWLQADPDLLAQVLGHLLNNATRFTAPGGEIRVSAAREEGAVALRVRDNGVGIEPELLPHIFHLFMRPDRGLGRKGAGLGVGLTLARKLMELQGGSVEVHSDGPGRGSEFVLRLPALEEQPPAAAPGSPLRVLVVDNSIEAAQSIAGLVAVWGYEVRVAYDGPTALTEASAWRPQAVLLDIGMPGMDGYEVARRLREQTDLKGLVLVAVTGYGQEEDRRHAQEAGFDFHMTKPAPPEDLRELLVELAESLAAQRQSGVCVSARGPDDGQ